MKPTLVHSHLLTRSVAGLPKDESAIETDADSYGDEHFEDD